MTERVPLFQTYPPFDELQEPDEDINIGLAECKFRKETQEEAIRFHCLYNQASVPLEVVVALCTGDFDSKNNIVEILAEISKAINDIYPIGYCKDYTGSKYHDIIEKIALASYPGLVNLNHKSGGARVLLLLPSGIEIDFEMMPDKIKGGYLERDDIPMLKKKIAELEVKAMRFDFSEKTLDDILEWLGANKIIDNASLAKAKSLLQGVRGKVFPGRSTPTLSHRQGLIKSLLKDSRYIYYDDAKEILFPEIDLREKLEASCGNNPILYCISSNDKKQHLFEIKSLMKWLVIEKKLDAELRSHFPAIVKEAIKQSISDCPELFTLLQLKEYLRRNSPESQDVRWHVQQEVYPAYIQVRSGNICFYSEHAPSERASKFNYETRYAGIERLKHPYDDTNRIFLRLLKEEAIEDGQSSIRAYDLDSTSDEAAIGLFRFIRPKRGLWQEDLVFIKNEVKAGLMKLQTDDSSTVKHTPQKGKIGFNFAGTGGCQNEELGTVSHNAMSATAKEIKDHIDKKIGEQSTALTSSVNAATHHIITPEVADDIVVGRKAKQQRSNAAKDAAAKSKYAASQRADTYLTKALDEAKLKPKHYSASSLSKWVCKQITGGLRASTIKDKILKDGKFEPYLKIRKPANLEQ